MRAYIFKKRAKVQKIYDTRKYFLYLFTIFGIFYTF